MIYAVFSNFYDKNLNKDFLKAVRGLGGGGVTV